MPSFEFIWLDALAPTEWGKFVVLHSGETYTVVAGNFEWHQDIVRTYGAERKSLIGAGKFSRDGVVETWKSEGYKLETPLELRPSLENLFKEQRQLIADRWQA